MKSSKSKDHNVEELATDVPEILEYCNPLAGRGDLARPPPVQRQPNASNVSRNSGKFSSRNWCSIWPVKVTMSALLA